MKKTKMNRFHRSYEFCAILLAALLLSACGWTTGGEIFSVERDGQPIPYKGPEAERAVPTPDAYVFLEAGASVSATVDLATAYDFSEPGEYTIAFLSPKMSHMARTEGEMATSLDDLGPVAMPSNQVLVTILEDL